MTDQELKLKYNQICNSLASRRLKPAFDLLGKLIAENGMGIFYDECRNLEETYQSMLKYTVEGVFDPERQKIYRKLIISVFELADNLNEALRMKFSSSPEYRKKRSLKMDPAGNASALLKELLGRFAVDQTGNQGLKENQAKIKIAFYHVWFNDKMSPEEAEQWNRFFKDSEVPMPYRAFLITAFMLSLLRYFDPEKFMLLFDQYDPERPAISQRALTGLLINLFRYDRRMPFYPDITGRLKILYENPAFRLNLETIITQFIRSKETEKLQQRIREEILPEMIKISPHLRDKINLEGLMEEGISEERNPDWEDIFKDSPGFLNKMEEFSEMQMKGEDVFMGSFSMLKTFPFFDEMTNWFMPFFRENPDISDIPGAGEQPVKKFIQAIEKAPILCNSDKYSFCLSIQRMPQENVAFMTQAMQAEMDQINEIREDEELLHQSNRSEYISNQFIQDLYRFYKLFPGKAGFEDVFEWRLDFHNTIALGEILKEDRKMMRNIAEYYFGKKHYMEAAGIFDYLVETEKNSELYQKLAWCYQKTGDWAKALDFYLTAELHGAKNLWNMRKIALCYRNLKEPAKALDYYHEAEKNDPDDLGIQLNIGQCFLELNEFEEALKCYFKVEYLAPGNKNVWRPIGWCSFLTGKKEQAEKYFRMLIDDEPNKHDYINMGHVQWSLGNRKAALEFYRKSVSDEGFSEDKFLKAFDEDLPQLLRQGIDRDDVPIMLDQLRYNLE